MHLNRRRDYLISVDMGESGKSNLSSFPSVIDQEFLDKLNRGPLSDKEIKRLMGEIKSPPPPKKDDLINIIKHN